MIIRVHSWEFAVPDLPVPARGVALALSITSMLVGACAVASPTPTVGEPVQPSVAASAAADEEANERTLVDPNEILAGASRYGDLVFTAGFLGLAPGDDFEADVNDALDQLEGTLNRSGAGFDTLLKVNVYLTDWDTWETFNRVYNTRIVSYGLPPRTTVEVSQLGLDAPIEIAAVAHVRQPSP